MEDRTTTTTSASASSSTCSRHSYTAFAPPFLDMAVFGDSFSDVGNIHNASNGTQPGVWSYDGRYSDGRVWEEYIIQFFKLPYALEPSSEGGSNYAWGGATTDNDYIDAYSTYLNANVPSVNEQVTEYLMNENELSPQRLHVVYIGYNDYWWYVYRNYTTSDGQDLNFTNVYTNIATRVVDEIDRMYNNGARKFLVGNVPNMSTWAEASLQTQDVLDSYDVLVSGHNKVLSRLLNDFESSHAGATVYEQDNFRAFECINEQKNHLGYLNVQDPCYPNQETSCGNIFSYKFWDYYHPSTHSHHVSSTFAIQSIYDKEMSMNESLSPSSSSGIAALALPIYIAVSLLHYIFV